MEPKQTSKVATYFGAAAGFLSFLVIGLLPSLRTDQISAIGNAAGDGARLALFSTAYRSRAVALAERIRVVELSLRADFQEVFIDSMELGACEST